MQIACCVLVLDLHALVLVACSIAMDDVELVMEFVPNDDAMNSRVKAKLCGGGEG